MKVVANLQTSEYSKCLQYLDHNFEIKISLIKILATNYYFCPKYMFLRMLR